MDADAAAWAAAVVASGGTYSGSTLAAVSAFTVSAKASGYWTKLNRINLFCGDQLAAALVPLKVGGGSATDTNVNFVAGDYTEATGLTSVSSKYLRTALVPSVSLTANDTHLSIYNRGSTGGVYIGVFQTFDVLAPFTDVKVYSDQYDTVNGRAVSTSTIAAPYGFIAASRTAAAAHAVYRNGSSVGSAATSGGALPAVECYVFASNNAGTPNGAVGGACGGYSIGSGLSAGDATNYNTHMQAFQLALSRNV